MTDEPYNAGDPEQVNTRKKKADARDKELKNYVGFVMATPQGRKWVWAILSRCGIFHTPFAVEATQMAYGCGMQNIGLGILADIMAQCPEHYLTMTKEQVDG